MAWSPKPPWARSPALAGGGGRGGGGGGGANRGEKSWTSRQNFGWYFSMPAYFREQRGSFQNLIEELANKSCYKMTAITNQDILKNLQSGINDTQTFY